MRLTISIIFIIILTTYLQFVVPIQIETEQTLPQQQQIPFIDQDHAILHFNSTIQCINFQQSPCQKWKFFISLREELGSCFPSQQQVITKNGIKSMKQLQIGDEILGYNQENQQDQYYKLSSWLHRLQDQYIYAFYQNISTNNGYIFISPLHNLAVKQNNNEVNYIFAKNIKNSTILFSEKQTFVNNNILISLQGIYAPLTSSYNFYVVSSDNTPILVHCFAQIQNPTLFQPIYEWIEWIFDKIGLVNNNPSGISTFNQVLMKIFSYFLESQDETIITRTKWNKTILQNSHSSSHSSSHSYSHSSYYHGGNYHSTNSNNKRKQHINQRIVISAFNLIMNQILTNVG